MKGVKSYLRKIRFALGKEPIVTDYGKQEDACRFVPGPFKAVLLLCADFELAWAWRYAKGFRNPYLEALRRAEVARGNIPKILHLCEKYNIPITWATVGHLLLSGCKKNGHLGHSNMERIPYHENDYWKYDRGDWFDCDPCSNWKSSPEWYAPDLVKMILTNRVEHEIACHTFSHIDCSDEVCVPSTLRGEIHEFRESAVRYGLEVQTFVHPGHTIGNLRTLGEQGFKSFRTDYMNTLGFPRKHPNGLWELKSTMEFVRRNEWSFDYHIYRYREIINRALMHKRICLFWFHPSLDAAFITGIMEPIFAYIDDIRKRMWVTTMREYVNWLNQARYD